MKTLVVYYSKTGTTKKVALSVIDSKKCDFDELQYDEGTKTIKNSRDPSDYEHIIILSPVWAFSLAEPIKSYIGRYKSDIKEYDLIVTCGLLGLRGCVKNCLSAIGKAPGTALKFRANHVKRGDYDLSAVLRPE
ncbi:MAG: hypothetical protein FWG32_04355 [Oscillospiraceae bacterium]|nr:hypothetical protein [Oscillospiraceae bacterium]